MVAALSKIIPASQDRLYPSAALVGVALLVAWMGNVDGGYFLGGWTLPAIALAAATLLVSAVATFGGRELRWAVLALGVFTAYTAWTLASVLWSANKGAAWIGAGQTYLYLLAFLVTVALITMGASRRWVLAALVLGPAAIAALTLLELGSGAGTLFDDDRLVGTVGYYNGEAAFLLASFWIAVYLSGSRRVNPIVRGLTLAGAVLCLDLAVLTQSRGAMVALAVSLPVFFLLSGKRLRGLLALLPIALAFAAAFPGLNEVYATLSNGGEATGPLDAVLPTVWFGAACAGLFGLCWGLVDARWRSPAGLTKVVGSVALAACLIFLVVGGTVLVERTGNPVNVAQSKWEAFKANDNTGEGQSRFLSVSSSGRYTVWQVAWKVFSTYPIIGVGTNNWEGASYELREQPSGFARQPHSLPLEVLSERGAVGGALFFGFLVVCVASGAWQRFTRFRSEGKAQAGALIAAVAYWFVHSSAEWFWQLPAVTMPAIMFLAMLVAPWRDDPEPVSMRWPLRAGSAALAALAVLIVVPLYVADRHLAQSFQTEDPKQALASVERARAYNPFDTRLAQREAEVAAFAEEWDRAEEARKQAIRLNPEHYAPYYLMAEFYEARGQKKEAREYYQKALALNPLDPKLRQEVRQAGGSVQMPDKRGRTPQQSGDQTGADTPPSPNGSFA